MSTPSPCVLKAMKKLRMRNIGPVVERRKVHVRNALQLRRKVSKTPAMFPKESYPKYIKRVARRGRYAAALQRHRVSEYIGNAPTVGYVKRSPRYGQLAYGRRPAPMMSLRDVGSSKSNPIVL